MTIDIHGHVTSPELFKRFPMPASLADIDGMIEQKAALGIDITIVGSPVGAGTMVPVPGLDNYDQSAEQLDSFHEWVAETIRDHDDHLRGYVYVNPFGGADGLDRAAKRLAQPEFVGLIVNTSVRGEYLGSPAAEDFFALAAETGSPVLLHPPAEPVGAAPMNGNLGLIEHVSRPCDITCGVASILLAGWLDKYPTLKLIAANAGGALSLLREKLDLAQRRAMAGGPQGTRRSEPSQQPDGAPMSQQLSRIYVDTATPSKLALTAAVEVFGPEHMLFGTDSPPLTAPLRSALDILDRVEMATEQRQQVLSGNACELFGLTEADKP
ncbi:MAG: amidohydrolase [Kutzneria sp.]|nr:amidohydrolase [Kutzneria sp.]